MTTMEKVSMIALIFSWTLFTGLISASVDDSFERRARLERARLEYVFEQPCNTEITGSLGTQELFKKRVYSLKSFRTYFSKEDLDLFYKTQLND